MHQSVTPQVSPALATTSTTAPVTQAKRWPRARIIRWAAMLCQVGMATIVLGLLVGGQSKVAVGFVPEPWDKLLHTAVFATFVLLMAASHPRWGWHVPPRHQRHRANHRLWLLLCVLVAGTLGAADEIQQHFLPGRSADLDDWLADLFGATLGALAWSRWAQRINR